MCSFVLVMAATARGMNYYHAVELVYSKDIAATEAVKSYAKESIQKGIKQERLVGRLQLVEDSVEIIWQSF